MEGNENSNIDDRSGARKDVLIGWGLFAGGFFTMILYPVAIIWAIIKNSQSNTDFEMTHYKSMISMFIWTLALVFIGILLFQVWGVGIIIIFCVTIWNIFRISNGLIKAYDGFNY